MSIDFDIICVNPLYICSFEAEDTLHYLLHCHYFNQHRLDLMNSVKSVLGNFESLSHNTRREILLYSTEYCWGTVVCINHYRK